MFVSRSFRGIYPVKDIFKDTMCYCVLSLGDIYVYSIYFVLFASLTMKDGVPRRLVSS